MRHPAFRRIADRAARRYQASGRLSARVARGKLLGDPVFEHLVSSGMVGQARRILDLGCGRGLLAAVLEDARRERSDGAWPSGWTVPTRGARVCGVDRKASDIRCARRALGAAADFVLGDITHTPFPDSDLVFLLDVLHYLPYAAQLQVLERAAASIFPQGRLVLRVGDAGAGSGFVLGTYVDLAVAWARGQRQPRLYCRPVGSWTRLLGELGFRVEARPMSRGTPFANVLLIADPASAVRT